MATPREHMQADMDWLFAEDGNDVQDIVIDAIPYRAIPHALENVDGQYDGQTINRLRYLFLSSDFSAIVNQEREIDGKIWRVVAVARPGNCRIDVTFERYMA